MNRGFASLPQNRVTTYDSGQLRLPVFRFRTPHPRFSTLLALSANVPNDLNLQGSRPHPLDPLRRLMETLRRRAVERPDGSYTTRLIEGGVPKMAGKIREEADELIEAAELLISGGDASQREHFVDEAADLIYHTMVLLAAADCDLSEVAAALGRREGVGGLVEKASRTTTKMDNSGAKR